MRGPWGRAHPGDVACAEQGHPGQALSSPAADGDEPRAVLGQCVLGEGSGSAELTPLCWENWESWESWEGQGWAELS